LSRGVRVVLDTNIVVAGTRSDQGASFQLLLATLERRLTLLLSVPLCLEYEAVLTRRTHLRATGAAATEVRRLIDALVAVAEPVEIRFLWRPGLRDPDDAKVLEAAVNGRADWLVTFNVADLAAAVRFGVNVGAPAAVLRLMRSASHG
jgi:putative PIN family toxin of toxin-antitoxin system